MPAGKSGFCCNLSDTKDCKLEPRLSESEGHLGDTGMYANPIVGIFGGGGEVQDATPQM